MNEELWLSHWPQPLWLHSGAAVALVPRSPAVFWGPWDLCTESMWSAAKLASTWSSMRSNIGLSLQLLYVATMGEMLTGLLSREASPSSTLAWEESQLVGLGPPPFGIGTWLLLQQLPSPQQSALTCGWNCPSCPILVSHWPLLLG